MLAFALLGTGCAARNLPEAPKALAGPGLPSVAVSSEARKPPTPPPPPPRAVQSYLEKGLRPTGAGTGFFVQADSRLLTNNHVVEKCDALSIETTDGTESLAKLVATDPAEDLALIQADIAPLAVAKFREKVRLDGRRLVIIGYPTHGLPRIKPMLVWGNLVGPTSPDGHRFRIEADIHPGNSGGPVLDESGLVVGEVFAKINSVAVYQNTGRSVDKIGFAITNETIFAFLARNGMRPEIATSAPTQDETALFDGGRQFITRVLCWRSGDTSQR